MKSIKIIPTKKFGGSWCAEEAPGVASCFPDPNGKRSAIDYARDNRFGGSSGEIQVFDETGETITVTGDRPFGALTGSSSGYSATANRASPRATQSQDA